MARYQNAIKTANPSEFYAPEINQYICQMPVASSKVIGIYL